MPRIPVLSAESFAKLAADHDRLERMVWNMERRLRAFNAAAASDEKKPFARFHLTAALAKTEASKSAVLDDQYGAGVPHATVSVTVQNPEDATNGDYTYYGASGATGWAFYDPETDDWWIFDMDCPGT
jgi:hypothetical protein